MTLRTQLKCYIKSELFEYPADAGNGFCVEPNVIKIQAYECGKVPNSVRIIKYPNVAIIILYMGTGSFRYPDLLIQTNWNNSTTTN